MSLTHFIKTERKFLTELLQMYKEHPCLWDQTNPDYSNKEARMRANETLLEKYKSSYEDATMDTFRKRIDNMRAGVRRERRKVLASIERGDDPHYTPRLWYFKHMMFLEGQYKNDNIKLTELSTDGDEYDEEMSSDLKDRFVETDLGDRQEDEEFVDRNQTLELEYYDSDDEPKPKKPTIETIYMCNNTKQGNTSVNNVTTTKKNSRSTAEEETEAYGKAIGLQLKQLDSFQRTVAEKIISDAIFYGRLNKLSANSYINLNADKYN